MVFYHDGLPTIVHVIDFGDGSAPGVKIAHAYLDGRDEGCFTYGIQWLTYLQSFDSAQSYIRLVRKGGYRDLLFYYAYDPAHPYRLEKVEGLGNVNHDTVLQKESPPGSAC